MAFLVFDGLLGEISTWQPPANFPHCFRVCLTYWSLNSQSGIPGCAGSPGPCGQETSRGRRIFQTLEIGRSRAWRARGREEQAGERLSQTAWGQAARNGPRKPQSLAGRRAAGFEAGLEHEGRLTGLLPWRTWAALALEWTPARSETSRFPQPCHSGKMWMADKWIPLWITVCFSRQGPQVQRFPST